LAAAKLEWENDEVERARILLQKACGRAPSAKVWMKLALLEREVGLNNGSIVSSSSSSTPAEGGKADEMAHELATLDQAIAKFPDFAKFYLMAGQACERAAATGNTTLGSHRGLERARAYYQAGLRRCPQSLPLWITAAGLEVRLGQETKGRSLLELARLKNPKSDLVRGDSEVQANAIAAVSLLCLLAICML